MAGTQWYTDACTVKAGNLSYVQKVSYFLFKMDASINK